MDIHFTEVNDLGNSDFLDESQNYWETSHTQVQKKSKMSYDDILNSLNLVVNNGVLQYMTNHPSINIESSNHSNPSVNSQPLNSQMKNSYIFNKYFKDYTDTNDTNVKEVRVPKTMQEYKQMILEDRIKYAQERNRIARIKSTKMLYENNHGNRSHVVRASKNNLRMMKFG
jgi:hypothetical protein